MQSAVQPQRVMNSTSTVFCPPNFPSIHQALLGASHTGGDQSAPTTMVASAVATVTASVAPNPAVIKTMLASKLARNMTHQASNVISSQGTSCLSTVPSTSSLTSTSAATFTSDVVGTANENSTIVTAPGNNSSTVGMSQNSVKGSGSKKTDVNGLAEPESTVCFSSAVTDSFTCTVSSSSSCLSNGHAKQMPVEPSSTLTNGICSPVPSCSSEDQEPLRDVKVPRFDRECDGVVVNGDVASNEIDDEDDVSEANDCVGDMLEKAMMQADIIDCGGRPAVADNSCDDDSRLSAEFLSGYVGRPEQDVTASDQVSGADADAGFDSETAAAVADLLHDTGMDTENSPDECAGVNNKCLPLDNDAPYSVGDNEFATPSATNVLTSDTVTAGVNPTMVHDEQLHSQSAECDAADQMNVPREKTEAPPVVVLTSTSGGSQAVGLPCSANSAAGSLPQLLSTAVHTQRAAAQLQNGVMVVPPRGISLPSGQFISGGTRLLIRPITSVPHVASSSPSQPVRLTQPTVSPCTYPAISSQSTMSTTSSSPVEDGSTQLSGSNTTLPSAVRFVSTTSQGQLIIQRAQLLNSANSPLIQRVIVPPTPQTVAVRSEGQTIFPATQPNQQLPSRPVLLTQAPFAAGQLGQLRVAGPGMQLVPGTSASSAQPAQIVLQSGHVISAQPHQPSTLDSSAANKSSQIQTNNLPILAAKPSGNQQQNQSTTSQIPGAIMHSSSVVQTAVPPLSTSVNPSLRPLMSTSQQPVQIVGGPVQLPLRANLVGLPSGTGNASVILQHGGRPILLQSPNVGTAQCPRSSYVVFRPGPLAVPPSAEQVNNIAVSSSSSSVGADRKRALPIPPGAVTRSIRKKNKKDEDCTLPFMCEWSGCQRYVFLCLLIADIAENRYTSNSNNNIT